MHEFSIVEELMKRLMEEMEKKNVSSVKEIHLRRESTFSQGALEQAFEMLSPNTPLQGARLIIHEQTITNTCAQCGKKQTVMADDLVGHQFICPECGHSVTIDEHHGLEVLDVVTG